MRTPLISLVLLTALCLPALADGFGEKRDPEAINRVMKTPVRLETSVDPAMHVVFDHQDHKTLRCELCHHQITAAGERYASCGADASCHVDTGTSMTPNSRFQTIHERDNPRTCYGCHFARRAAFGGVKGCTTCHD